MIYGHWCVDLEVVTAENQSAHSERRRGGTKCRSVDQAQCISGTWTVYSGRKEGEVIYFTSIDHIVKLSKEWLTE